MADELKVAVTKPEPFNDKGRTTCQVEVDLADTQYGNATLVDVKVEGRKLTFTLKLAKLP